MNKLLVSSHKPKRNHSFKKFCGSSEFLYVRSSKLPNDGGLKIPQHLDKVVCICSTVDLTVWVSLSLKGLWLGRYSVPKLEEIPYLRAVAERVTVFIIKLRHYIGVFIRKKFRELLLNLPLKVCDSGSTYSLSIKDTYHQ